MRVTLFIDGKNFFAGWKDVTGGAEIDFRKLSQWVVRVAGGTHYMGAYYYTGVDSASPHAPGQEKLENFLSMLEMQPGFFVQRFAQKVRTQTCSSCGHSHTFSQEKEVDTTIVADMLRLAATSAFDVAVLISGDADLVPAVEGVRALGQQVHVASWGASGLSPRIRRAAFDHIDLMSGLNQFARTGFGSAHQLSLVQAAPAEHSTPIESVQGFSQGPVVPFSNDPAVHEAAMLEEIRRAQTAMPGGYVGAHFFVTRWRSAKLPEIPDFRRRILDRLQDQGKAEVYITDDGVQAVRLKGR